MTTFLFWNINKRPLQDRIARLAVRYDVDVIVLAECAVDSSIILGALNRVSRKRYWSPPTPPTKTRLFANLPSGDVQDRYAEPSGDLTIWHLKLGDPPGVLLAGIHLPSKMDWSDADQALWATELVREIRREEGQVWHDLTILVGDFNMNPFDLGVSAAQAFHGMMALALVRNLERKIKGRDYRFFYNPMWGLFGDRTPGPPGTFYLRASKPGSYFWNMYDQIMLRPGLADKLKDLRIIDHDGVDSLLTKFKLPKKSVGSDHLPILFTLNL
jgi:hypothetical protein